MRHLLNTLYITSEDLYLSLDGENVVVNREKQEVARYPLTGKTWSSTGKNRKSPAIRSMRSRGSFLSLMRGLLPL